MFDKIYSDDKGRFCFGLPILEECLSSIETIDMQSIFCAAYHGFRANQFNQPDGFCVLPLGEVISLEVQDVPSSEWVEGGAWNFIEPKVVFYDHKWAIEEDSMTEDFLFDFFMSK